MKKDDYEDESWVYIQTDKGVYPISVLKAAEKPKSKQLEESEAKYLGQHDLIPLPFEASALLGLKDNCSYFDACVKQIAEDVVGQGWTLVPREGKEENEEEKKMIEEFFETSGGDRDETFSQSLKRGIQDWGMIGWYGFEVSREEKRTFTVEGKTDYVANGFWHVAAQTIRVHKSHEKYCQVRGMDKVWFRRYGSEKYINYKDGKEKEYKGRPGKLSANEMIFRRNYYPQSDYYGAPNILPAVGSVLGLIGVRDYNLAFFENYGIPAALIVLSGKWDKKSAKQISDFIDVEIKRSENAHKTMIIHPSKDSTLTVEKLSVDVKEGSFRVYQKELRNEVLVCYKMPPYRIGLAEVGPVSKDTEVLTKEGWKLIPKIKIGEEVATLNLFIDRIQYQPVQKTYKRYYEHMVNFSTHDKTLDVLASHDHRMWLRNVEKKKQKYRWYKASEILEKKKRSLGREFYIRTGGIYEGNGGMNPDMAALVGWIASEGSPRYRKGIGYEITLYQKPGKKSDKIEHLLKRLNAPFTKKLQVTKQEGLFPSGAPRTHSKINCYRLLGEFKRKVGDLINWQKRLPMEIFESSLEARLRCLDTLIEGDGSQKGVSRSYYSSDQVLADQVSILALISGMNARVNKRKRMSYSPRDGMIERECYEVSIFVPQHQVQRTVKEVKEVKYKDFGYCLTVENGTLLYRRKGQAFIAGNTLGGTIAPEANLIYASAVVGPLEEDLNRMVTNNIILNGLGSETYTFVLNKMDTRDLDAEVKRWKELFAMGAMTPNQIIKRMGGKEYDAGNQYYVAATFVPVGEESVEKRERALFAEVEELKARINEIIEKEEKK